MASATQYKGPTSSQKRRRGKQRGSRQDSILITDIDTESCFLGIIEVVATNRAVVVKNLHTDKLVHCTTHKISTRFFNKGTPVVFSYISDNTGEIVANYSTDNIAELTYHFKINDMKGAKHVGQLTSINNLTSNTIDTEFNDIINNLKLQESNIDIISNNESESEKESEQDIQSITDNISDIAFDATPTVSFKNKKKVSYQRHRHEFYIA